MSSKINTRVLVTVAAVGCAIILLTGAVAIHGVAPWKIRHTDLLSDEGWLRYMGATTTPQGLRIVPLDRSITHQDGSVEQDNPPVNFFGPHIAVMGDFRVTATMRDIDEWGSLRLYGELPITYDQWRHEGGSINIEVATSSITVRAWDGSSSSSIDMRTYKVTLQDPTTLVLEHRNEEVIITANTQRLGTIPDHAIFKSGEMWFGTDAAKESKGWMLTALNVFPYGRGTVKVVEPEPLKIKHDSATALRNLATARSRNIYIGAAVSFGPLVSNKSYRNIAAGQFNMWTPENALKPQFIHPKPEKYAFTDIDTFVDIGSLNGVNIHGHSLVYHKSNPTWMNEAPKGERQKIMLDHITTVASHFRGRVAEWDVVNEPLSDKRAPYKDGKRGLEPNIWYEAMGENYIDLAFRAAHKADPKAKLYLNDYGLEHDGDRFNALLGLVQRLRQRGVPIDGVGFESHVYGDGDYSDAKTLKRHMDMLAALGLKVRISEIDVTGDDPHAQIDQYVLALDVCLRSPNCTGYATWGVTDLYGSTTRSDRYPLVFGTSLLWDSKLQPKPAYSALQKRLQQSD